MKSGIFAVYQGIEYKAGLDSNIVTLRSYDSSDAERGFSLYKEMVYVKKVQKKEVDEVYSISTLALYQGFIFGVYKEEGEKLLLFTDNYIVSEKLGLDMVDRGVYEKWVSKNDVTSVYEEKKSL